MKNRERKKDSEERQVSEEQIIEILKQSEAGAKTSDLCRQYGISAATFYAWRGKYGGMEVSEAKSRHMGNRTQSSPKRPASDGITRIHSIRP